MIRGYISVYLSLTLAIMLSLVLTLVEGARLSGTRLRASCAADVSINSVFSEYNRELLKQYDLLFVDMSYGTAAGNISNVERHLKQYLTMNLDESTPPLARDIYGMRLADAVIEEYALATDNEAEPLRRQVSDYMRTTIKGNLISGFDDLTGELDSAGYTYDVEGRRAEVANQIEEIGLPVVENENGELEEVPLGNPADGVNAIRSVGILGMVLDNCDSISRTKINPNIYISNRTAAHGSGISDEERRAGSIAGKIMYDEYVFDKFGYYGHEKVDGVLAYQIEYILKNKDSDWDNLEAVCRNIAIWREAINFVYLMTDAGKQAEAEEVALALAAVTLNPDLYEPVKWSILLAWSYVETLQDMKILLEGGGVAPWKSAETWHTPISALLHPRSALKSFPNQGGARYGDYLKTLLVMKTYSVVILKSMDVMEMDIRNTQGNSEFKIDECMNSCLVYIQVSSTHGHNVKIRRRNGYYYV